MADESIGGKNTGNEELVSLAAGGDESAFAELVRRHQDPVYGVALRFLSNADDAEEAAAEAFVNAWKNIKYFKGQSSFSTWIYRITVNACLNKKKKTGRFPLSGLFFPSDDDKKVVEPEDKYSPGPERAAEDGEITAEVKKAADSLPDRQKMALILSWQEAKSYGEIAEMLGTSVPSVESLLSRAKETLRKKLSHLNKS